MEHEGSRLKRTNKPIRYDKSIFFWGGGLGGLGGLSLIHESDYNH